MKQLSINKIINYFLLNLSKHKKLNKAFNFNDLFFVSIFLSNPKYYNT